MVPTAVLDRLHRLMNHSHEFLLTLSGGRIGTKVGPMPVIRLTTTGRRSGQPRTVMLTVPVVDGDRLVLVASKGGDDRHPDWYRNLAAQPTVTVERLGGETTTMTARTVSAGEKAELWPRIVASYRGYAGYQRRTEREIPVVVLEPAG